MSALPYLVHGIKTLGLYLLALLLFRLMGKRCLGDMEPLDFVVVIVIAEVLGQPLADPALPFVFPVLAVVVLALVQISLAHLTLSSPALERLVEGKPIVVIEGGRVLRASLRRAKVSPAELAERLRQRGYLNPGDIELATLETDGMLSVIPRREASPVTPRFLGLEASRVLLVQGRPDPEALREAGLTAGDLEEALRRRGFGLEDAEEVTRDPDGRLHVTLSLVAGGRGPASKELPDTDGEG